MTTLVTGATGFVGSAVARCLIEAGHRVRILMRPTSDRANLTHLPAGQWEPVVGDLRERASLEHALRGCRYAFHVAAEYRLWHPRPAEIYATNVDGTRNLLAAAEAAGVERVVYTSSVATLGIRADGRPADEDTPVVLDDMIGHYKRSKFLAEREAERFAQGGLDVVIVNPSAPVGPRDRRPTPTGRLVLDAATGRMPAYVDTGLNLVHVEDVAQGHLRALEYGLRGHRYVLGERDMSLREILVEIARLVDRPAPRVRLSPNLLMPVAWLSQGFARVSGGAEPRVTVDGLRLAKKHMYFSHAKATRELGYEPRSALEGLRDAIDWFRAEGYMRA